MPTARNRPKTGSYFEPAPPRVLAHRGLALDAPENTLLAFAKALALGVNHLETDVHESSDGVAIISHDSTLERVAGRKVAVNQLTAAELRRVELGNGQNFTTLKDALDAFPDARFNIDVKSPRAIEPTVAAIRELNATPRVLVSSFSERTQRATAAQLPGVATSASMGAMVRILAASTVGLADRATGMLAQFDAIQIPEKWKGVRVVSPRLIRLAHRAGVEVHVWTVNEPEDMLRLVNAGVDGIVTDRADLAVQLLRSRR